VSAVVQINLDNQRNIEVLVRRLILPRDVVSAAFRNALASRSRFWKGTWRCPESLFDAGLTGVCSPTHPDNARELGGRVPFARTGPRTHAG
jgi:hypothetical protein